MRITEHQLKPAANNLTLARLILASLVNYTHSFLVLSGVDRDDLTWLLGSPLSHHAVDGFFFLAGFLVYRSLEKNPSISRFVLARATRLLPGLALMIVIVVSVGAAITKSPLLAYLSGLETVRFILFNLSLIAPAYDLTGVLCSGQPCNVNGSIWTLPWEARCYALLAMLALTGASLRFYMRRIVLPLTACAALGWAVAAYLFDPKTILPSGILYYLDTFLRFWPAFALGIWVYEIRGSIPLSWLLLAIVFTANLAIQHLFPPLGAIARLIFAAYFVLCVGFLSARYEATSAAWPDYSFGIYIYSSPVMKIVAAVFAISNSYLLTLTTLLAVTPLASLSWHVVESPALTWLRRRRDDSGTNGLPTGGAGADLHASTSVAASDRLDDSETSHRTNEDSRFTGSR